MYNMMTIVNKIIVYLKIAKRDLESSHHKKFLTVVMDVKFIVIILIINNYNNYLIINNY